MPGRTRARVRTPLVLVALFGVLAGLGVPVANGAPPAASPPVVTAPRAAGPGNVHTVTLITGDKIEVDGSGGGTDGEKTGAASPRVTVVETAPRTRTFSVARDGSSVLVIPDQAMPLLAAGRLDRRLFDVTGLVRQAYDDERSAVLPLLVEYAGQSAQVRATATNALAGTHLTRDLPRTAAVAATLDKSDAAGFWTDLAGRQVRSLAAGATKVWLDGKVHATLDRSVPQIGAPAAWARGFDGHGVTVAVLDSGIDVNHPDLAGQVVAAHNFTEEPDTTDHVGHGTHVASTVAGTGAGSAGRYKGVAPGARLLNGKVLQLEIVEPGIPTGLGQESWIIAGMEWAVDQGADIVNMSLGDSQRDGNDPLSRTLDSLTAESGTLFVVSAGNEGPDHYSVDSPAAADGALAVGSVNRDESVSAFSSLGPRLVDGAVKPDVTAPGQEIVAARAAGARVGHPVNALYTAMSGTSMAAPHVAGAAALLRQQHPDWKAAQLRAALTSTAAFNPAYGVYEQGGGRIDVDRATRQDVQVDAGTLSLGSFAASLPPSKLHASRTLTYRNSGTEPVTLALTAAVQDQAGDPAEAGTLTVRPETVTVPAGGSAQATVTADVSGRAPGAYSGRVVATGPDGIALGTPVGFYRQGTEVDVTFRAIDRHGKPAEASLVMRTPMAPGSILLVPVPEGGSYTVRLAPGDYTLLGSIRTPDASGRFDAELTAVADPEFDVAQPNRTVTLDARQGRRLGVQVPRDVDVNGLTLGMQVERDDLTLPIQGSLLFARGATYGTIPAVPTSILPFDRPRHGHGDIDTYWSLVAPRARAEVTAPKHDPLPVALMDTSARIDGTSHLSLVDAGTGSADDFARTDVTGKLVLLAETGAMTYTEQATAAAEHGAAAVLLSSALPGSFYGRASADIPVLAITRDAGDDLRRQLERGPVRITLSGDSRAGYLYDLVFREHDQLAHDLTYRPGHLATVRASFHAMDVVRAQRFFEKRVPTGSTPCGYCVVTAREGEDWHGEVTRTDYVTAGVDWRESVLQDSSVQWSAVRSYRTGAGETSYGRSPVAPGVSAEPLTGAPSSVRDGDRIKLRLAGYTDADPTHTSTGLLGFVRYTSVALNGVPLGPCGSAIVLVCDITNAPAERATYVVTADFPALGSSEVVPPSTTTWTFSSAHGESVLPLIDLDYDLPVSLANTMPGDTPTTLRLGVHQQPGAAAGPVQDVRVDVSFDDGTSWTALRPKWLASGAYRVDYRNPVLSASNGFVAFRVQAVDPDGNSIVQVVKRAYRLTAGS